MKIYTNIHLAEIICRQFDLPGNIRSLLELSISRLNDKRLARECNRAGFEVFRIRKGLFIIQKIN